MATPTTLSSDITALAAALSTARVAVVDFETTGLRPHMDQIVGMGIYLPEQDAAFYINMGHGLSDARYLRYDTKVVAAVMQPFVADLSRHLIAHNATFDMRWIIKMGLDIRCRISCSLVHSHRVDENLHEHHRERTTHFHTPVTYGLKELTVIYFNEKPPTLHGVIGQINTSSAPVHAVATYCILDCYNTWRLYHRAEGIIHRDLQLRRLTEEIDDPNLLVLTKMMAEGILVDMAEASRQIVIYQEAIQACRNEIWRAARINWPLDTPSQMLVVLRHLQVGQDLGYDPFYLPLYAGERDPSVSRDVLFEVFEACQNPDKRRVIAAFIAKTLMEQRLSSFLKPLPQHVQLTAGRLYPNRFSSTLVTTRFSCSPNLQNMPRKMGDEGDIDEDEVWRSVLPPECTTFQTTKDIFLAKPGHTLVVMDLSAAEPRYLSLLFQRALSLKDSHYQVQRQQLQQWRREAYPLLLTRMRSTAKPYEAPEETNEIVWPEYDEDPLYRVFKHGQPFNDPYNAMLVAMMRQEYEQAKQAGKVESWLENERWRGKRAFLALGYGSSAENLCGPLNWSLARTQKAIADLEKTYATLNPLRELTLREMIHIGEVRSLWGRPRRINGYYQLARPEPITIGFYRMRPVPTDYEAEIIPLGSTRQAVQAFVKRCYTVSDDGKSGQVVLEGDESTGGVVYKSAFDAFANADHFNRPPFRNISFNMIKWVRDQHGLTRQLPRQARAQRQAFNALCQATGADHLRWLMNRMDAEICQMPEFTNCKLVLTVHDSLIYEVPDEKVEAFIKVARPVMQTAPDWCDIPIKVGIEVGRRYGDMQKWKPPQEPAAEPDRSMNTGCLAVVIQPWLWTRRKSP